MVGGSHNSIVADNSCNTNWLTLVPSHLLWVLVLSLVPCSLLMLIVHCTYDFPKTSLVYVFQSVGDAFHIVISYKFIHKCIKTSILRMRLHQEPLKTVSPLVVIIV